jgi:folate-dependent tRNA-U54 methylase TrmFO/GidA
MTLTIPRHTKQWIRVEKMQRKSKLNAKQHTNLNIPTNSTNFSKCWKSLNANQTTHLNEWKIFLDFDFYDANTHMN